MPNKPQAVILVVITACGLLLLAIEQIPRGRQPAEEPLSSATTPASSVKLESFHLDYSRYRGENLCLALAYCSSIYYQSGITAPLTPDKIFSPFAGHTPVERFDNFVQLCQQQERLLTSSPQDAQFQGFCAESFVPALRRIDAPFAEQLTTVSLEREFAESDDLYIQRIHQLLSKNRQHNFNPILILSAHSQQEFSIVDRSSHTIRHAISLLEIGDLNKNRFQISYYDPQFNQRRRSTILVNNQELFSAYKFTYQSQQRRQSRVLQHPLHKLNPYLLIKPATPADKDTLSPDNIWSHKYIYLDNAIVTK